MMEPVVAWALRVLGIYLTIGVLFAVPFALVGSGKIDPAAAKGTWGFRVLILPGAMIFWPLLMCRWVKRAPPPEERSAHRNAARE
jgi:hypothetical protein